MSPVFDCTTPEGLEEGVAAAKLALADDECIVLPTDTVYGIGADAFSVTGVTALLAAKGRGRDMPPPVLIPDARTVDGLAMSIPSYARRLMDAFWPGGLTLIFRAQPSLAWDLGETNGTVALRMPDDDVALALLGECGPTAVSSANQSGKPAATTVTEAGFALGPAVDVYLDGGPRADQEPSTILDCTKADPVVLRQGAVPADKLREVLAGVELIVPEEDAPAGDEFGEDDAVPDDEPDTGADDPGSEDEPESDAVPGAGNESDADAQEPAAIDLGKAAGQAGSPE